MSLGSVIIQSGGGVDLGRGRHGSGLWGPRAGGRGIGGPCGAGAGGLCCGGPHGHGGSLGSLPRPIGPSGGCAEPRVVRFFVIL